ncbi:MAG: hypothetical protein Tsb0014_28110 [Pleurocapsa sp.]
MKRTRKIQRTWRFLKQLCKFFQRGIKAIIVELITAIATFILAIMLNAWGISDHIAIILGLILSVAGVIFCWSIFNRQRKQSQSDHKVGEIRLACWIARTLHTQASREWEEYQDWLHDILLARRQLLNSGYPVWKVALITYWRLGVLFVTVNIVKLRKIAIAATKWR